MRKENKKSLGRIDMSKEALSVRIENIKRIRDDKPSNFSHGDDGVASPLVEDIPTRKVSAQVINRIGPHHSNLVFYSSSLVYHSFNVFFIICTLAFYKGRQNKNIELNKRDKQTKEKTLKKMKTQRIDNT